MKDKINWKIFFILLTLSLISVICIFPYVLTIQGEIIAKLEIPIGLMILAQFIQSIILFAIVIFLGLFFTKKIAFRLPLIEAIVDKRDYQKILKNILGTSILLGCVVGVIIYVLDPIFTLQGATISTHQSVAPVWQTLLAAVYGGVTEEILMRLFLMALLVWLGMKLFKKTKPTSAGIVVAIVIAAVVFGLGHLPITAAVTEITPLVVGRAIVLNGVGGIVFGWLFWKKGFESAVIAHFTADVVLLTLLPLL